MKACPEAVKSVEPKFFIKFSCKSENISTHWGSDIKRKSVTWITIYTDIITSLVFLIAIIYIRSRVLAEIRKYK